MLFSILAGVSAIPMDFTYTLYAPDTKLDVRLPRDGILFNDEGLLAYLQTIVAPKPTGSCGRYKGLSVVNRFNAVVNVDNVLPTEIESIEDILDDATSRVCPIIPYYGGGDTEEFADDTFHTYYDSLFYTYNSSVSDEHCSIKWVYTGSVSIDHLVGITPEDNPDYTFGEFCRDGHKELDTTNTTTGDGKCLSVTGDHIPFWDDNCGSAGNVLRLRALHDISFVEGALNGVLVSLTSLGAASVLSLGTWAIYILRKRIRRKKEGMYTPLANDAE
jgi:hypothetical protein